MDDLGTMVAYAARAVPTRTAIALRDGPSRSYAELDARTNRAATALLGRGLRPGDRVLAWMGDSLEYLELYVAAAKAGLAVVPLNQASTLAETQFPVADSEPRAVVFTPEIAERALAVADALDPAALVCSAPLEGAEDWEAVVASGADVRLPPVDPETVAIIGYTSGTTGRPKGAMLTHRSIKAIARTNALSYRLVAGSVCAFTGSMSFVATVPAHYFCHLYLRGTTILMGRWEMQDLGRVIAEREATFTYLPSPRLVEFADYVRDEGLRLPSLVTALHSGSKARPDDLRRVVNAIDDRLVEGLGMTENSGGLVTATALGDLVGLSDADDPFASVGRAAVDSAVEVMSADGEPLPHDGETVGELALSSPALMSGYWRNPEATAAALHDGWYWSGDLGCIDEAGFVYVSDRRTDLIVSGGMNVYPSEVEEAIAAHPDVADVAVVGLPDERWGQTVVAAVVIRDGSTLEEEAVIAHTRERLSSYKKPTSVVFVDALPRTASLKVKRHEVREALLAPDRQPTAEERP